MSTPAPAEAAATETVPVEVDAAADLHARQLKDGNRRLRRWAARASPAGHPVRDELWRAAMSASLRRLVYFGIEPGLQRYAARDLLQYQAMADGEFAALLARIAASRAMVEDDREVLAELEASGVVAEAFAWFAGLLAVTRADAEAALAAANPAEELHVARLILARRFPDLLQPGWFAAVPAALPRVAAALASCALTHRRDLAPTIAAWLPGRDEVLASVEPDDLLANLVLRLDTPPDLVLEPFTGWYGERTVLAAAEWYLEHGRPGEALQLASRTRPLSTWIDRARLIVGLASLDQGDAAQAKDLLSALAGTPEADVLALALAKQDPAALADEALAELADRCVPERPEGFFTAIRALVERRRLDLARVRCQRHGKAFPANPEIVQLVALVLGREAAP